MFLSSMFELDQQHPGLGSGGETPPAAQQPGLGSIGQGIANDANNAEAEAAVNKGRHQYMASTGQWQSPAMQAWTAKQNATMSKKANPLSADFVQGLSEGKPTTQVAYENAQSAPPPVKTQQQTQQDAMLADQLQRFHSLTG